MTSIIERTVKGGAGYLVANVLNRGGGFLFVFVASRLLGVDQFGVLALGLSVIAVMQGVAAFGLPASALRFLSGKGEKEADAVYGTILIGAACAAMVMGVLLFWSAPFVSDNFFSTPALVGPLRILSIGILVAVPYSVCHAVLQAQERVRSVITVELIQHGGKVLIALGFFLIIPSIYSVAWAVVVSTVLSLGMSISYLKHLDMQPVFRTAKQHFCKVLHYAAPLVIVSFSYLFALQADRLMLGMLADASAVGVYTVASSLAMVTMVLHSAMISVFKPIASEAYRNKANHDLQAAYLFIGKWVGIVNGLLFLIYVGLGSYILELFGAEYATHQSYWVLLILTGLYFLGSWVGPTGAFLQMTDGEKIELVNTLVFVSANVVLNYVLIPQYGILGAALATLSSGILRNTMQCIEIFYWHHFVPITPEAIPILVFALMGVGGCVMIDAESHVRTILALLIAFSLGYHAIRRVTPEEKKMLGRLVSGLKTSPR